MILIRLMGGLGNQMFQYAFGRALALRHGAELLLDTSLLAEETTLTKRDFELGVFKNIEFRFAEPLEVFLFNGDPKASLMRRLRRRWLNLSNPRKLTIQVGNAILPDYLEARSPVCLVGRWQSYKFFQSFENLIRKDFDLSKPSDIFLDDILELINSFESVCIHVRRGDLVTVEAYNQEIGVISTEYYLKAMAEVEKKITNPTFFVFSDDIEWCKENLNEIPRAIFVDQKYAGQKALGHFFLMQQCKHFILSNSTFAWWAAYLCVESQKIVIYPKNWNQDPKLANPEMCPPDWKGI